jgi:hypothetical protein
MSRIKNRSLKRNKQKRNRQEMDDLVRQMNVCKKVLEKLAENLSTDKKTLPKPKLSRKSKR